MTAVLTLVVCFITSVQRTGPDMAATAATAETGLKVPSIARFDKLATLDRSVIAGKIGAAPPDWMHAHRADFFGVFGFGQPWRAALCGRPRKWQVLFVLPEPSCSATDERRQSRPKPFGSSTA